jgi:arylsulfatase A-like enzyme
MDAQIGRLLQRLRERGFYDDSLIAVVSDHGQGLGDHGWYQHRLLYREQIWVPLILRVPDGPRGVERSPLVRSIDILPTIADYLSIDPPAEVTGRSLRNVLNGVPDLPDAPRVAYAEALVRLDTHSNLAFPKKWNDLLFCVMDRDWKLIYHRDKPENSELYDLRNDPKELKNVIDQYADQKNRLMQILEKTGGLVVQEKETAPIDQETQKRLQALGYIGDDGG